MASTLKNYIGGEWVVSAASEHLPVNDPATNKVIGQVPLSPPEEANQVVQAAAAAFEGWRRTPATARIQPLFKLKDLLEANYEDIARMISLENGKTLGESRGEMRRAIENVEVACGIPLMMQSEFSEDIASGIDGCGAVTAVCTHDQLFALGNKCLHKGFIVW